MKRIFSLILSVLLIVSALSGCILREDPPVRTDKTAPASTGITETETETYDPYYAGSGAAPLLWRVTAEDGAELYLFGTFHVGDARSRLVMRGLKETVLSCDALAVEVNVVDEDETGDDVFDLYLLQDGTVVRDHLSPGLYRDMMVFLTSCGCDPITLREFGKYHPAFWLELVEEMLIYTYSDHSYEDGMERLLIPFAESNGMPVLEIEDETAHYNIDFVLPDSYFEEEIRSLLDDRWEYLDSLLETYENWLYGFDLSGGLQFEPEDEAILLKYFSRAGIRRLENGTYSEPQALRLISETVDNDDDLYALTGFSREDWNKIVEYEEELLDKRNAIMTDRAVEYLGGGSTVFFAVGAAHMEGPTGIPKQLEERGYTVEVLPFPN